MRTIVYLGLYRGPPILGNYHVEKFKEIRPLSSRVSIYTPGILWALKLIGLRV